MGGFADCLPPGLLVVSRATIASSPRLAAGDPPDRGDLRAEGVCSLPRFFSSLSPLPFCWVWELCDSFGGWDVCWSVYECVCVCECDVCGCVFRVLFLVLSRL